MSRQLLLEIIPAPNPSLDNMVAGSNLPAIDAARGLSAGRALYVWGAAGSGKTHLLRGLASLAGSHWIDSGSDPDGIAELATEAPDTSFPRLVAIDDIHEMSESQLGGVFALYNRWREQAAMESAFAMAVSGHRAPRMMELREDLRTRLGWDLVFRLEPLSDRDKQAALADYAKRKGLPLTSELIAWMLTHYARDIRQLFALVDALDRYSLSKHRAVTVPLLRAMLADREFLQS
jgi:DnaA family protein